MYDNIAPKPKMPNNFFNGMLYNRLCATNNNHDELLQRQNKDFLMS